MRKMFGRTLPSLLLAAAMTVPGVGAAFADDDRGAPTWCRDFADHDLAYLAVQGDLVRPLAQILDEIGAEMGSAVIEIELECEDGVYQYAFKVRTPGGRIMEVKVDAATGLIVETED